MDNLGGSDSLVQKWEPVLEGIENDYTRRVTAQLLENQAKQIVSEQLSESGGLTTGSTTVGQLGTFQKFAFPLVRRVYPELVANNIVGVQPMQGPVSQIFYLGNTRAHADTLQTVYSKYKLTYRGLNNEAIGSRQQETGFAHDDQALPEGWGTGQFTNDTIGAGSGMDLDQEGQITNLSTSGLVSATAGGPSSTFGGKIAAWPHTNTTMGWTVSGGEALNLTGIPEMQFHIQQQAVVANTRKMRALWTIEASQDLKAYHNLDLERELTDLLSNELRLEIDRELIEDLRMIAYDINSTVGPFNRSNLDWGNSNNFAAAGSVNDSNFGDFINGPDMAGLPTNPAGSRLNVYLMDWTSSALNFAPRHVGDTYANLLALINIASQDIYKSTQRGPGNWMICAPVVASMLESSAKLNGGIDRSDAPTNMDKNAIAYVGKFMGRYDLYVDPLYPEDEILMGYKGSSPMDAGYVYAPYIPLQGLPKVVDPQTFQPRKGLITRYGKAAITPESRFYRVIRFAGPGGLLGGWTETVVGNSGA